MTQLAIIGGSGLTHLAGFEIIEQRSLSTPFGEPSSPLLYGDYQGTPLIFLARHGMHHTIPPHKINYRANIWALKHQEVEKIIAVAAVGSIHPAMHPTELVIPHQLVDYTWSREHTFFSDHLDQVTHIDFTYPYCEALRADFLEAAHRVPFKVYSQGVYGVTQGPRLETAAEINKMERDGCDIVGMTGMPETALARELGMCYATCAIVTNYAAGRGADELTMEEIKANLVVGIERVHWLLKALL